jgi:copper homeostasis protein (lipoprotein)
VRATIREGGRLRFAASQAYPASTAGGRVILLMRSAASDPGAREPAGDRRRVGDILGALPATFIGMLPCADCMGIRYQINLLPGGAYMQRLTYLRSGHEDSYYELGAWSLSGDGHTLALDGGREGTVYWAVRDARTLRKLDRDGQPIDSKLPSTLKRRASMEPMEPRVQLRGMFQYMADAARFRDCRSGLRWPVAMSDDYQALERAYNSGRTAPGSELLVAVDARIEQRPSMDRDGSEATLVVEKFLRAMPGEECKGRTASNGLGNTRWRPIRIGSLAVGVTGQQHEPWIELDPRSKRVTGSGGCNRIVGGYESGPVTLRFGRLISTQLACTSMGIETAFFRALNDTRRYRVQGRSLELLDDNGRVLVSLEERNLR